MSDGRDPVLDVRALSVERDGRRVLDDVSLAVHAGELHAVMGPNGAGKSSLVAAVLGRLSFTGSIVTRVADARRVGFVPQGFDVDRTLPVTVLELLALTRQALPICLGVRASARARIAAALARVGLEGFEHKRLGALSGGELRRVLVANAVEPDPELLVLDEPGAGLDEASRDRLDALLLDLKRRARTGVLLVSHDAEQVRRVADRVTVLRRTVLRAGAPAEVLADGAAGVVADG